MSHKTQTTRAGLEKLQNELDDLKINKMKEISQKIGEAREQGDLSENAEYDAAKEEQGHIASRIAELEEIIKNAEVVDESLLDYKSVNIGCEVTVKCSLFPEEIVYHMVGSTEASSLSNKLSNESPVGKALMNKEVGDEVEVVVPAGTVRYTIIDISRDNI